MFRTKVRWMKLSVMFVVISFMPQKIAVGAGIIVSLIAIFGFFPDGKCNGTVGLRGSRGIRMQ